jgi:plastocyanin
MLHTMIAVFLVSAPNGAAPVATSNPPLCLLSGKVELKKNGEKIETPAKGVVVYVEKVPATAFRPVNAPPYTIVQAGLAFSPSVLVLQVKDTVNFYNNDLDWHSVFSNSLASTFDFPKSKQGVSGTRTFMFAGAVRIQCNIHPTMRADVLVLQNPFWTFVESNGSWRIPALPAWSEAEGEQWVLVAWEPNSPPTRKVLKRCYGETTVTVPALEQQPPQKPVRKDGSVYPEYEPD